jgi:CBS domain-containing protein
MSPRAACRLELLGFTQVYDYVAGKADWLATGLPTEGEQAQVPRVKDVLRRDAVTARPEEPVGAVAARVARSPYGFALVVAQDATLLGRLRKQVPDGDPAARAEDVMEAGPSTVRADRPLGELAERLRSRQLRIAVVTAPDGRLLGVVRRVDMEARLAGNRCQLHRWAAMGEPGHRPVVRRGGPPPNGALLHLAITAVAVLHQSP